VPLGFTASASLFFTLQPGEARAVIGSAALEAATGSGSAFVQIETREEGGSWTVTDGASEPYTTTEDAFPTTEVAIALPGTAPVAVRYEARGTVIRSNGLSGPLTASRSTLSI
jgi:hypothetical protein